MNPARPAKRFSPILAAGLLALGALPGLASADTLWIGEKAPGSPFPPSTVQDIKEGVLTYKVKSSGDVRTQDLARVQKMQIDGETQLNSAEEAFAKSDWAGALEGYKRAASSGKAFVKTRAVTRMIESAANTKQFEAQVAALAELFKLDPALAAKQPKIALPTDKAKLKAVLPALEQAQLAKPNEALKSLIVEIALAADDLVTAKKYTPDIAAAPVGPAVAGGNPATPSVAGGPDQAAARLNSAKVSLKTNNALGVIAAIEGGGGRASFTKPDQQFEALHLLAEAHGLQVRDAATAQAAAVAYMRVVTHAKALGKSADPAVADAMLKAATLIETKLNQPKEALSLYNALATDQRWEKSPTAAEAKKAIARLTKPAASAG